MDKHYFRFENTLAVRGDAVLSRPEVADLARGFLYRGGTLSVQSGESKTCRAGAVEIPVLAGDEEFRIEIREDGFAIAGRDDGGLLRGFYTFLSQIECDGGMRASRFRVPTGVIHGRFSIPLRIAHICVFPETTLFSLRRSLRLLAALCYTHVIVEFWGTLKMDALPDLFWRDAYSKEQVRPILDEARALGLSLIPMFNHFGHASGSRISGGKHMTLDLHPELAPLFTPDGWAWEIRSPEVNGLLANVRTELCDLFGPGEYFHLGCDEAYIYARGYASADEQAEFLNRITRETEEIGRRPVVWGDMLLPRSFAKTEQRYTCSEGDEADTRKLLGALSPRTVIADWQYSVTESPVRSALYFRNQGFTVWGCPWFRPDNIRAFAATAENGGLDGVMMTTWHTLSDQFPSVLDFARVCGFAKSGWSDCAPARTEIATFLRKVSPDGGSYTDFGFDPYQLYRFRLETE